MEYVDSWRVCLMIRDESDVEGKLFEKRSKRKY